MTEAAQQIPNAQPKGIQLGTSTALPAANVKVNQQSSVSNEGYAAQQQTSEKEGMYPGLSPAAPANAASIAALGKTADNSQSQGSSSSASKRMYMDSAAVPGSTSAAPSTGVG